MSSEQLTTRQLKAIPIMLAVPAGEQGCKSAKISKATFYAWMKDASFVAEFSRPRRQIIDGAFGLLARNIEKAVSVLVELLDVSDDRVKRLTGNDVIGHLLKHRELVDLQERIERIEKRPKSRP